MKFKNANLWIALLIFLVLSQFVVFGIQREVWFDTAFTQLTIYKMQQGDIDFSQYDVHPPTYYEFAYSWMKIPHAMLDHLWLQELSVVFGLLFLVVAYFALKKAFGIHGEYAVIGLAMLSSVLHYGTESRQYMLVLLLSAVCLLAIVYNWKWYIVPAGIAVFFLPLTHYFAGMAVFLFVFMYFLYTTKVERDLVRTTVFVACGVAGIVTALFDYALPQLQRITGTWLPASSVLQWSSSLFHAFFFLPDDAKADWFLTTMFVALIIAILVILFVGFKWLFGVEVKDRADKLLFGMFLSALFPLVGLLVLSRVGALYHHRFFLVVTWLFVAATLVLAGRSWDSWVSRTWPKVKKASMMFFILVVIVVSWAMLREYVTTAHHEITMLADHTPCSSEDVRNWTGTGRAMFVHNSPFSLHPFEVYRLEHGCSWTNVLSTDVTPLMGHAGGFDVLDPAQIYWNMTLPEQPVMLYFLADGSEPFAGMEYRVVAASDGASVLLMTRIGDR